MFEIARVYFWCHQSGSKAPVEVFAALGTLMVKGNGVKGSLLALSPMGFTGS